MFVHSSRRGQGVGGNLLKHLLELATTKFKISAFELTTEQSNKSAIQMYLKHGFVYRVSEGNLDTFELICR